MPLESVCLKRGRKNEVFEFDTCCCSQSHIYFILSSPNFLILYLNQGMQKTEARILIVDDDPDILTSARIFLKQHFTEVIAEQYPQNLNQQITTNNYDVVLLDMNFRKGDSDGRAGLYWLNHVRSVAPDSSVILMTAYGEIELAVKAIKEGASDFVLKPWKNEKLLATIIAALRLGRSRQEVQKLRSAQKQITSDETVDLIGQSDAINRVRETIEKVAKTDANVLLLGENGTGKEVVARMLHQQSLREMHPFISVDLGAIHENLFESELFGHVKGAFTDAADNKPGRFELASNGSLFLDEIGNLSVPLQAKLLAALQRRKVIRIGSNREIPIDIRLICATNMPLYDMTEDGRFRMDLLYRINTVEIHLPPLRDRGRDVLMLADYFVQQQARKYHKEGLEISKQALQKLEKYHWPGNIRELQHAIERAVILSNGDRLEGEDFLLDRMGGSHRKAARNLNIMEMEKQLIMQAIAKTNGNISHAARELGLTRTALYRRLEKHDL